MSLNFSIAEIEERRKRLAAEVENIRQRRCNSSSSGQSFHAEPVTASPLPSTSSLVEIREGPPKPSAAPQPAALVASPQISRRLGLEADGHYSPKRTHRTAPKIDLPEPSSFDTASYGGATSSAARAHSPMRFSPLRRSSSPSRQAPTFSTAMPSEPVAFSSVNSSASSVRIGLSANIGSKTPRRSQSLSGCAPGALSNRFVDSLQSRSVSLRSGASPGASFAEVSRLQRKSHADLIAHARAVERETAEVIERSKASSDSSLRSSSMDIRTSQFGSSMSVNLAPGHSSILLEAASRADHRPLQETSRWRPPAPRSLSSSQRHLTSSPSRVAWTDRRLAGSASAYPPSPEETNTSPMPSASYSLPAYKPRTPKMAFAAPTEPITRSNDSALAGLKEPKSEDGTRNKDTGIIDL
eukprot:TRINITY_DN3685_c0_g1_i1.p1 TRINITY_DN3685_c0_g1~~TRINITY_DN3685_c0_g1_i1.p1  ORF type:complete len:426 (-),score=50.21 TRINITY_DN3685_c0_g1_i1:169-1404(-)